jgi:membrane glycosyltransferase
MLFLLPPTFLSDESNNNAFRILINKDHPFPVAVGMQEWQQYWHRFWWHLLPSLVVYGAAYAWLGTIGIAYASPIVVAIALSQFIKKIARKDEFFGQVVEAVVANEYFGSPLEVEMTKASAQLKDNYNKRLGIGDWTQEQVEEELYDMLPRAQKYVERKDSRVRKFIKKINEKLD